MGGRYDIENRLLWGVTSVGKAQGGPGAEWVLAVRIASSAFPELRGNSTAFFIREENFTYTRVSHLLPWLIQSEPEQEFGGISCASLGCFLQRLCRGSVGGEGSVEAACLPELYAKSVGPQGGRAGAQELAKLRFCPQCLHSP
jgi:hypothetical protein